MTARALALATALGALSSLGACARDVNSGNPVTPYPNAANVTFVTREPFQPGRWYFMVFNFTQEGTGAGASAFDQVSNEDRGRNWQLYVAHTPANGAEPARLVTLQRPALPTLIPTANGPSDAAVADFGGDSQPDIAVAATGGGVVQLIRAIATTNLLDPVFYDTPFDIYTGTAPRFLFASDFTGDSLADLLLVDAGAGGTAASVRLLTRTDDSVFSPGPEVSLTGRPDDALLAQLNGDTAPDLVVATSGPGAGQHQLEILLNDGSGVFTAAASVSLPEVVRGIGVGELTNDLNADLAVGVATAGGAESVRVLAGNGNGGFTAGPTRSLPGTIQGLTVADMNGTLDDIVATYTDPANGGSIAAFTRNQATPELSATPELGVTNTGAGFVLADELGNDNRRDAVFVDPGGNRINIMRGEREVDPDNPGVPGTFAWNDEEILYPSGNGPSRLRLANLNADGNIDIVAINSGAAPTDGNSIALYFGLRKYNYTSADIYWTDDPPNELQVQQWYLNHAIGPNSFTLSFDPGLFFDLARQAPDEVFVQFFTATTGIDLVSNPDQLGEVRDYLSAPVRVPMTIGHTNDEQQSPLAGGNTPPNGAEDIVGWAVEVL